MNFAVCTKLGHLKFTKFMVSKLVDPLVSLTLYPLTENNVLFKTPKKLVWHDDADMNENLKRQIQWEYEIQTRPNGPWNCGLYPFFISQCFIFENCPNNSLCHNWMSIEKGFTKITLWLWPNDIWILTFIRTPCGANKLLSKRRYQVSCKMIRSCTAGWLPAAVSAKGKVHKKRRKKS